MPPDNTEVVFLLGQILQSSHNEDKVVIGDALEILKYIARMKSVVIETDLRAWNASLITPASKAAGKPAIGDALEILKHIAGMKSLVN